MTESDSVITTELQMSVVKEKVTSKDFPEWIQKVYENLSGVSETPLKPLVTFVKLIRRYYYQHKNDRKCHFRSIYIL